LLAAPIFAAERSRWVWVRQGVRVDEGVAGLGGVVDEFLQPQQGIVDLPGPAEHVGARGVDDGGQLAQHLRTTGRGLLVCRCHRVHTRRGPRSR
jgi:hypothetical protein